MARLVLASSSPRRREILGSLGLDFDIVEPDADESIRDALPVKQRVLRLAEDKSRSAAGRLPGKRDSFILGADTLVSIDEGEETASLVLGKPASREEAREMIQSLSGRGHSVHTGLALLYPNGRIETIRSDSEVRFAAMTPVEIETYLDSGDWMGVAGAYKVQGMAALYIERIEGTWSGIVGLPIRELYVILTRAGLFPPRFSPEG